MYRISGGYQERDLNDIHSRNNIIPVISLGRVGGGAGGHLAIMGEKRSTCKISVRKL